jgi:hypothetical protein
MDRVDRMLFLNMDNGAPFDDHLLRPMAWGLGDQENFAKKFENGMLF